MKTFNLKNLVLSLVFVTAALPFAAQASEDPAMSDAPKAQDELEAVAAAPGIVGEQNASKPSFCLQCALNKLANASLSGSYEPNASGSAAGGTRSGQ